VSTIAKAAGTMAADISMPQLTAASAAGVGADLIVAQAHQGLRGSPASEASPVNWFR
jgi:hypothetical protein